MAENIVTAQAMIPQRIAEQLFSIHKREQSINGMSPDDERDQATLTYPDFSVMKGLAAIPNDNGSNGDLSESIQIHLSSMNTLEKTQKEQNNLDMQKNRRGSNAMAVDHEMLPVSIEELPPANPVFERSLPRQDEQVEIVFEDYEARNKVIQAQTNGINVPSQDMPTEEISGSAQSMEIVPYIDQQSSIQQHQRYVSSFNKAESILRNLPNIHDGLMNTSCVSEVDSAMLELERQQVSMIRQVIRVQLRRMLDLLKKIKLSGSEYVVPPQASSQQHNGLYYAKELVQTCVEAILIMVVPPEEENKIDTAAIIREFLSPAEFNRIVYTWAEELRFEQACSEKVLAQIFAEFDVDGDGVISEDDLVVKIQRLIFGAPLSSDDDIILSETYLQIVNSTTEPDIIDGPEQIISALPEQLEIVLDDSEKAESERDNKAEFVIKTSGQVSQLRDFPVSFESDGLPSQRNGKSFHNQIDAQTLLRLRKSENHQDLINMVEAMAKVKEENGDSESLRYHDFEHMIETQNLQPLHEANTNAVAVGESMIARSKLQVQRRSMHQLLHEPKSSTMTQKLFSQDDREPLVPLIDSEFQSNGRRGSIGDVDFASPDLQYIDKTLLNHTTQVESLIPLGMPIEQEPQHQLATEEKIRTTVLFQQHDTSETRKLSLVNTQEGFAVERASGSDSVQLVCNLTRGAAVETAKFGQENTVYPETIESSVTNLQVMKIAEEDDGRKQVSIAQSNQDLLFKCDEIHSTEVIVKRKTKLSQTRSPQKANPTSLERSRLTNKRGARDSSPPLILHKSPQKENSAFNSSYSSDNSSEKLVPQIGKIQKVNVASQAQSRSPTAAEQENQAMVHHNLFVCNNNTEFLQSSPEQMLTRKTGLTKISPPRQEPILPSPRLHQTITQFFDPEKVNKIEIGTDPMSNHAQSNYGEKTSTANKAAPQVLAKVPTQKKANRGKRPQSASHSDQLLPLKKIKRKGENQTSTASHLPDITKNEKDNKRMPMGPAWRPAGSVFGRQAIGVKNKRSKNAKSKPVKQTMKFRLPSKEIKGQNNDLSQLDLSNSIVLAENNATKNGFSSKLRKVDFSDVDDMIIQEAQLVEEAATKNRDQKTSPWSVEDTKRRKSKRTYRPTPFGKKETTSQPTPSPTLNNRDVKQQASLQTESDLVSSKINPTKSSKMPPVQNQTQIDQSEPSQSPPKVLRSTANNGLQESFLSAKDLKQFSSSFVQPKKLEPLDKRLAEARFNGLNAASAASVQRSVSNSIIDGSINRSEEAVQEQGAKQLPAPLPAIDWGPEPDPIYSSNLNQSIQLSNDNMSIMQNTLWAGSEENLFVDMPYQSFINAPMRHNTIKLIKLRATSDERMPKRNTTTQQVRSRQVGKLEAGIGKQLSNTDQNNKSMNMIDQEYPASQDMRLERNYRIDEVSNNSFAAPVAGIEDSLIVQEISASKIVSPTPNFQSAKHTMSNLTKDQIRDVMKRKTLGQLKGQMAMRQKQEESAFACSNFMQSQSLDPSPEISKSMQLPGHRTANEGDWKSIDLLRLSYQPQMSGQVVMEESSGERDINHVDRQIAMSYNVGADFAFDSSATNKGRATADMGDIGQPVKQTTARRSQLEFLAVSLKTSGGGEAGQKRTLLNSQHPNQSTVIETTTTQQTEQADAKPRIEKQSRSNINISTSNSVARVSMRSLLVAAPSQIGKHRVDNEKKFAAYTRKGMKAMYRSIQQDERSQPHRNYLQRGKIEQISRASEDRNIPDNVLKDLKSSYATAGGLKQPRRAIHEPIDVVPVSVTLSYQPTRQEGAAFPKLNANRSRYLAAQSQQSTSLFNDQKSRSSSNQCETSQLLMRQSRPFNRDIQQDLSANVASISPRQNTRHTGGKKFVKPFFPNNKNSTNLVSQSLKKMPHNNSQLGLSAEARNASNLYMHHGAQKTSPLNADLDMQRRQSQQKQAQVYMTGNIRTRLNNNAKAKLNANFDIKRRQNVKNDPTVTVSSVLTCNYSNKSLPQIRTSTQNEQSRV